MAEHYTTRVLQRDSHDLSLSPRNITRDSLVTNMLLSLDQFSNGFDGATSSNSNGNANANLNNEYWNDSPAYDGAPPVAFDQAARSWVNGASANEYGDQAHRHQYSYSSDLDDSSKMSSQHSRGRRSNSSSNFQAGFSRLNSGRDSFNRSIPSPASRGIHSRGGVGSKSSSSASIDAGYAQGLHGNPRHNRSLGRSASFDQRPPQSYSPQFQQPPQAQQHVQQPPQAQQHAHKQQQQQHPSQGRSQTSIQDQIFHHQHQGATPMSPFQVEFPTYDDTDDFEAAPTPTVHGGPRREPSMPTMPPPPEPVDQPTLMRERASTRSLRSSAGRKSQSQSQSHIQREPVPALPSMDLYSAPAPLVGYEKSKEAGAGGPNHATAPAQAKERPGFFRRVFGSSKNNSPSNSASHSPSSSRFPQSPDWSDRPGSNKMTSNSSNTNVNSLSKAPSVPPSRDTSSSHSHHYPVLQKKPSSFFRRRKKSVVDDAPPLPPADLAPPVPAVDPIHIQVEKERQVEKSEPSPVSSLRKVMNPYLNSPGSPATPSYQASPLTDITNTVSDRTPVRSDREEFKREFSPDYEPSPKARIRTVRSISDHQLPQRSPQAEDKNNSFLDLDGGSDNEDESTARRKSKPVAKRESKSERPVSSPTHRGKDADATIKAKRRPPFFIEQTDSEEDPSRSNLALPIEGARGPSPLSASAESGKQSATPSVHVEDASEKRPKTPLKVKAKAEPLDEPDFVVGEPTADDRQKAQRIFDGNEDFIQKEKAASWMGEEGPVRQRTLKAYMDIYDFSGQSIVHALRQVCGRLVFRAETQQVDRLLVAFSKRWCMCNPKHGFKAAGKSKPDRTEHVSNVTDDSSDVIHTICYSIMLLNTDLHLADIEQKMTRSQFIKNTMTTITQAVAEAAPDAFRRPSVLPEKSSFLSVENPSPSHDQDRKTFRNSFRGPNQASGSAESAEECGPLVNSPFTGLQRAWEDQIEIVLKAIYNSIRDEKLPLFGADAEKNLSTAPSQNNLSVIGMLKRSPSVLSKAPSESQLSTRGRIVESTRNGAARWASKSRSRPGFGRNGFSSSRTSFEDGNSLWSPALSSATWSRYSLGRTQTSASQDSFASSMPQGDYQQSIGFANALSQAIIRDEDTNGHETAASIMSVDLASTQLLEDESLELAGPPWVKEGIVIHKHHLDGVDKKAKDRNWSEVFAVVQKGQMSLFSFTKKSTRQKSRTRGATKPTTPVGGGNWQENATNRGTFSLRQTLASSLPPPGYSRSRPHVWALSLPSGAVHLFQVGTPELIKEFVNTVNFWSARLSTHPLIGGISNIEYGWSDLVVNNALVAAINDSGTNGKTSRPGSSAATGRRSSVQSGSFRSSSFDQGPGSFTHSTSRGKLPGDRIHITVWTPPAQSMRPSNATEVSQLGILNGYVKSIEEDLQTHNQLRSPMLLAFTPRGHNAAKAMANWERKSAYLLREIVKYTTYVDCLHQAELRKKEIYAERDLAHRAARGELITDTDLEVSGSEEGDETLKPQ